MCQGNPIKGGLGGVLVAIMGPPNYNKTKV